MNLLSLTDEQWFETAVAAGVVVGVVVVAFLLTTAGRRALRSVMRSRGTDLDDQLGRALRGPIILLAAVWGIAGALHTLSYLVRGQEWINRLALAITVLVVTFVIRRVIVLLLERQAARPGIHRGKLHPGSLPLIRRGLTLVVFAAGFLVVLDTLGIAISPLLAGLGIGGIAIALALQPLLANVFASSYMLSDSSLRIGDLVEMQGGPFGTVDDIGWRATRIRTFDNNIVIVPNAILADATVSNFTLTTLEADARLEVAISLDEDLDRVLEICTEVLTQLRDEWPLTVKDHTPVVLFLDVNDAGAKLLLKNRAHTWIDSIDLKHEMIRRIHARFRAEGIRINYPMRRLVMREGDAEGLGDFGWQPGRRDAIGASED